MDPTGTLAWVIWTAGEEQRVPRQPLCRPERREQGRLPHVQSDERLRERLRTLANAIAARSFTSLPTYRALRPRDVDRLQPRLDGRRFVRQGLEAGDAQLVAAVPNDRIALRGEDRHGTPAARSLASAIPSPRLHVTDSSPSSCTMTRLSVSTPSKSRASASMEAS